MSIVSPANIEGAIRAPSSKSVMQRYVALATLTHGTTQIHEPSLCDDAESSLAVASSLGAAIQRGKSIAITGGGSPSGDPLDCGESGTALRIFCAVAGHYAQKLTLTARGSLQDRPMEMLQSPLRALGAQCETGDGRPPIMVRGPLLGGSAVVDGSVTSQLLSGLLIALPLAPRDSELNVVNMTSRPYVEMTLEAVRAFGGTIERNDDRFLIRGRQRYQPQNLTVEGDWSAAAFMLVAGATQGSVTVTGLRADSRQADVAILSALEAAGAAIHVNEALPSVTVQAKSLCAFEFDATDCPDLVPPLCALAASCSGTSKIHGVHRLIHKESNRAAALQHEFKKLGIPIDILENALLVSGVPVAGGVSVHSHHDHRIAMAGAIVALSALNPVTIHGSECVAKSYPGFFEDLKMLTERR